jgi:hypothetical protein
MYGFTLATQDEVIPTRNCLKYIIKDPNASVALKEIIQHVMASCPKLTQINYEHRNDKSAKVFHKELAKEFYCLRKPYFPYYKLYGDRNLSTEKNAHFHRPDLTLVVKINEDSASIDTAVPMVHSLQATTAKPSIRIRNCSLNEETVATVQDYLYHIAHTFQV